MPTFQPEVEAHREWLGQIQQSGLVVSAQVLVNNGVFIDRKGAVDLQVRLREMLSGEDLSVVHFASLTREFLEWSDDLLVGSPEVPLPSTLSVALPDYDDTLTPTYAVRSPGETNSRDESEAKWLALVVVIPTGTDLDKVQAEAAGWRATPHARLERLLKETSIPIGLLFNGSSLRLVYAPQGESSGYLTFRFEHLGQTLGRPMVGALRALLGVERVTDVSLPEQRLPFILAESRKYQNTVSTELAAQVLEALWELVGGFQRANQDTKGELLATVLREARTDVYGGLLTTMMRLVFILYAEDKGLMPASNVYQFHYSVSGLFERLREDQARNPDTMDGRFGAWAQLLVLFRLIHDGASHGDLTFPKRHGRLFDPDVYPFLEGRGYGSHRQLGESIDPPKISDGVVFRVLQNLLMLNAERLSYRTLDVEQIGSVYEAMMGFVLEEAHGPSIAVAPKHVVVNLEELLEQPPKSRVGWLKDRTELKVTGDSLAKARTPEEVVGALGKRVSPYTPRLLRLADLYLQPTEERRRSGSHYTPRALTAPLVEAALRPVFSRIGADATPQQVLDLKVCDPAMGSGAFLVEACRLLGDRLQESWRIHNAAPAVPPDEDVATYARRIVAERCLYGVDKNIFAVDLGKLSLWLATLAREHPFTFLDHSIRHGDSLVGLSSDQIASLHWAPKQLPLIRSFVDAHVATAQKSRLELESMGASDDVPEKARLLREANEMLGDVRIVADAVVSAFCAANTDAARDSNRLAIADTIEAAFRKKETDRLLDSAATQELRRVVAELWDREQPIPVFHWQIEFPEVFRRSNAGFDVVIGNPPFLGGRRIRGALGSSYLDWLCSQFDGASGNADLVAFFFRRAFDLLHEAGCLGLIATNTISQGDTRRTGLRWIRLHGGEIFAATRRRKWPGAAAVTVSTVALCKGPVTVQPELDNKRVSKITAYLFYGGGDNDPATLKENADIAYQGVVVAGSGFLFDDSNAEASASTVRESLIRKDRKNGERILPYIGGEEVNDSPTHAYRRWVISFGDLSEAEARRWPDLMEIVETKVRPYRETVNRVAHRRYWWQFGDKRPELTARQKDFKRVLVNAQVSQHLAFAFQPTDRVFAMMLNVFLLDSYSAFAVLQSRVHEVWTRFFASTLEDRLRYTPTDCFETFAFPPEWRTTADLEENGRAYYEYRAALMVGKNEGLTKTYNRLHDPLSRDSDIVRLRHLHEALDRAVLGAYGWTDIPTTCEFLLDYDSDEEEGQSPGTRRRDPWRYRWPDDVRDDVLGRLLELNTKRAVRKGPKLAL